MQSKNKKTVRGWIIPPTCTVTFGDILKISRQIGARVYLKYNAKKRHFVTYTKGNQEQTAQLRTLLNVFPEQAIYI